MRLLKTGLLSTTLLMGTTFGSGVQLHDDQPTVEQTASAEFQSSLDKIKAEKAQYLENLKRVTAKVSGEVKPGDALDFNNTLVRLSKGVNALIKTKTTLETDLATARGEKVNLADELAHARDTLMHLNQGHAEAGNQSLQVIRQLEADATAKAAEVARLTSELADKQAEVARLKTERDANAAEVARLTRELADKERERFDAVGAAFGLEIQVRELTADLAKAKANLANSEAVLASEKKKYESALLQAHLQLGNEGAQISSLQEMLDLERKNKAKELLALEDKLKLEKAQMAADLAARERALNTALEKEKKDSEVSLANLKNSYADTISQMAAANQKLAEERAARERELKAALDANDKLAEERAARERDLKAANEKLVAELENLRSAQTNSVARPLFDDGSNAAATARLRMLAGANPSQHSRSEVTFSDGHSVGSFRGNPGKAGAPTTLDEVSSLEASPDKPVLTGRFAAIIKAPAVSPDASDHDFDHRSPSHQASPGADKAAASPGAAAVETVEDTKATLIAKLQAELAEAQAIVVQGTTWTNINPPRNVSKLSQNAQESWNQHTRYLVAKADVERLTAAIAALEQAQPAGN